MHLRNATFRGSVLNPFLGNPVYKCHGQDPQPCGVTSAMGHKLGSHEIASDSEDRKTSPGSRAAASETGRFDTISSNFLSQ